MNLKPLATFLIILFFQQTTQAFFHFEPGIGYNRGHYQTSKLQGIGLTLKTGVEFNNTIDRKIYHSLK